MSDGKEFHKLMCRKKQLLKRVRLRPEEKTILAPGECLEMKV